MENLINLGIGFIQRPLNENQVRIHLEGLTQLLIEYIHLRGTLLLIKKLSL